MNTLKQNFGKLGKKEIIAQFNGGNITSDGGALLLHEFEKQTGIIKSFSECFTDYRDKKKVEHKVEELIAQRVYGIILGHEDLNDHDIIRADQLLATICGKEDPTGGDRKRDNDKGNALAGKSTLNRLELSLPDADKDTKYKKIVAHPARIDELFVNIFLDSYKNPPNQIILDLDATDDPTHGNQENIFFMGIIRIIAIYLYIYSVKIIYYVPVYVHRISTRV